MRRGDLVIPKLGRLDVLVFGLAAWILIRVITGGETLPSASPLSRWLFYFAMPVSMYFFARVSKFSNEDLVWVYRGIVLLSGYLAITAVFEVTGLHALVFPKYIVNPESWEFFGRGRGPLMNPAGNGFVMTIGLMVSTLGVFRGSRAARLGSLVLTIVILSGIYCTLTRSVWLGAIAGLGVIVLNYSPRWVRVLGLASVVLFAGLAVTGLKDGVMEMKRDKNLSSADAAKSVELRPLLAVVAYEMFKDRPIAGFGYRRYFIHAKPYHTIRSYDLPLEQARPYMQHNAFLSILVDTGLIGLSLFTGVLFLMASYALQLARNVAQDEIVQRAGLVWCGGLAAYFCNGMFHDVTIIPMVNMFTFFGAGMIMRHFQATIPQGTMLAPKVAIDLARDYKVVPAH